MEPTLNSIVVSNLKENLKAIGDLTIDLCGSSNPDIETKTKAQKINKLAHDMYELILMDENAKKNKLSLSCFEGLGVKKA